MAMPSRNMIPSNKTHFSGGPGPGPFGGGTIQHNHSQLFLPNNRDEFTSWLQSEFAAANAIIDSLCFHLRATSGEPDEYDAVIAAIQQRRFNWGPTLFLQQHYSVAEVTYALQQVAWRKNHQHHHPHQRHHFDNHGKMMSGKDSKRSEPGFKQGQWGETLKAMQNSGSERVGERCEEDKLGGGGDVGKMDDKDLVVTEEKKDDSLKPRAETSSKDAGESKVSEVIIAETKSEVVSENCTSSSKENNSDAHQDQNEEQNLVKTPKTYVAEETYDGNPVNVVEGLQLYEELIDEKEVSKLVSVVNDLRAAGKRRQLVGQTYAVSKRPMRGRGREVIQLGLPIADAPFDYENIAGLSRDTKVESIPASMQDVIDRLVDMQIMPVRPDSCIIDLYNEGDHSQPHMYASWFGRPVCTMFLSECDMTFGRVIVSDHPGDYKGSIKLSFSPGSLILMQGKSADFAKHAIDSIRKQRILITFTKYQHRKSVPPPVATPPYWGTFPIRPPNHIHHPVGVNHHATPVYLQPVFIPGPVPQTTPFVPPPGANVWQTPCVPGPGTGVFLPHGSGSNLPPHPTQPWIDTEMNGSGVNVNANGDLDDKEKRKDCNGSIDGSDSGDDAEVKGGTTRALTSP